MKVTGTIIQDKKGYYATIERYKNGEVYLLDNEDNIILNFETEEEIKLFCHILKETFRDECTTK